MVYKIRVNDPRCKFSAAHFLYQHDKCSRLHGHNYIINVEVTGELNEDFFVIDFFKLKSSLITIANNLDHAILLPENSDNIKITHEGSQIKVDFNSKHYEFPEVDVRILPLKATTAELLAKYIHGIMTDEFQGYKIKVEVGESNSSIAIFE